MAAILALVACWSIGCSTRALPPAPPPVAGEPVSVQMLRIHPDLRSQRFNTVLNFENPSDTVFFNATGVEAHVDESRAHTGQGSAKIDGGRGAISAKLSSILGPRPFPGEWTLLGAYFLSERAAKVTLSCEVAGVEMTKETTSLAPGRWTPAMIDLTSAGKSGKSDGSDVILKVAIEAPGSVWCDDLILIDNTQWLLEARSNWTVLRRGFDLLIDSRARFSLRLPALEFDAQGWTVEEVNPLRLRLRSTGSEKSITLYPNGRGFWDGKFRPLSDEVRNEPLWTQQQASPAQITVPQTMGRLNRNSSGDQNNDGYNETRGSYAIVANGPRIEINVIPRSVPVLNPVLEITGLPPGNALVTAEGSLIDRHTRLSDGSLLIELPIRVDRPVIVNVRVQ